MSILNSKLSFVVSALTASIIVSACGGAGDTAGIGGSGFISSGSVTGFGSVFVNGVEFETGSAIFDIEDDLNKTQADLRIGMVVQVEGTINSDGVTGTATGIQYSDDIEGPISNDPNTSENADGTEKTLTVLGRQIIISTTDTVYEGISYATIAQDNVVEVSGFEDQSGAIRASYVELKSATFNTFSVFEIKGLIENLSGTSFTVKGVNVDASASNLSDLPAGLQANVLVEVKGTYNSSTNTIRAREVDAENNDLSEDASEVELEGLITRYRSNADFDINGVTVNAANAVFTPASPVLKLGDKIEAEGPMLNGVLIALEVEVRGGNAEASAKVGSIDSANNSFTMVILTGQEITVQLTTATRIEDDAGVEDDYVSLIADLHSGDFVEVKGFESGASTITATQVKRESEVKEVELQGLVLAPVANAFITVLGVTFSVDPDTHYENVNDVSISHAEFITAATSGTVVSIKDKIPPDGNPVGTADEVEIEN